MSIHLLINGSKGRMGQAILKAAQSSRFCIHGAIDAGDDPNALIKGADVVIDFSFHEATLPLVQLAVQHQKPIVIGTTGHHPGDRERILACAKDIPIVWSGNYSVGMNLLFFLTQRAAAALPELFEPEITEIHHHAKKDAPSGTAVDLARRICSGRKWDFDAVVTHGREGITGERPVRQLGMHALRGGDVVGEHTVSFFGEGERVELRHLATDRKIFAQGALHAAAWVVGKSPGLYEMQDVLELRS
jgi:4-hydroxy-tetrahydrodipicolinate reductase